MTWSTCFTKRYLSKYDQVWKWSFFVLKNTKIWLKKKIYICTIFIYSFDKYKWIFSI